MGTRKCSKLLSKAHALEVRGHMDLAKQVWQQVLNGNSNQPEALAGMARANKLENHPREAQEYLNRLKAVNPSDPNIQRVETMGTAQNNTARLQEADRLAKAQQYAQSLAILREVYGNSPPAGDPAISYYETEAGSEGGRPHAIAGLRALMDQYPQDAPLPRSRSGKFLPTIPARELKAASCWRATAAIPPRRRRCSSRWSGIGEGPARRRWSRPSRRSRNVG